MELEEIMGLNELELYYKTRVAGIEGETFTYSFYFEDETDSDNRENIRRAIHEFIEPYSDREIYLGYVDVLNADHKIMIYLDLGNVDQDYEKIAIQGILKAINAVNGIKSVVINESSDF